MDWFANLSVRFDFKGEFINVGRELHYVGGELGTLYIERDMISLPEIKGYLGESWMGCSSISFFQGKISTVGSGC